MNSAAPQLDPPTLIALSPRGRIERIMWLHRTDRWYFGDFLRHASWLQWLLDSFPGADIDLASHPAYLLLYGDDRFGTHLDARGLDPRALTAYDLVIEPAARRLPPPDDEVPLVLATWDAGWMLHRTGAPVLAGTKGELNYFRAAHPSAITGTRNFRTTTPRFTDVEIACADETLARAFPEPGPVLIYNPTASNPHTRGTHLPKEVDNSLTPHEHTAVVHRLLSLLPDHQILIGASLKPGDTLNADMIQAVTDQTRSHLVTSLTTATAGPTIREFAALLANERVCSTTGSGTGTNTHLAALTGTCSFSIERGADSTMLANWAQPDTFQMGSFRWRNPDPITAIHTLHWPDKSPPTLTAAADAFACHHDLIHHPPNLITDVERAQNALTRFAQIWPTEPDHGMLQARQLLDTFSPAARIHYSTFDDEIAFLATHQHIRSAGFDALSEALTQSHGAARRRAINLFEDSNLHKLMTWLSGHAALTSASRTPQATPAWTRGHLPPLRS
jgi:hypothetical protein